MIMRIRGGLLLRTTVAQQALSDPTPSTPGTVKRRTFRCPFQETTCCFQSPAVRKQEVVHCSSILYSDTLLY